MFWIFNFFVINRLNDKVSRDSNPCFLESDAVTAVDDNDGEAVVNHSGSVKPVEYTGLRWDYRANE